MFWKSQHFSWFADEEQCLEKPERPPEPEYANTRIKGEQHKSSHSRAMSEGNIINIEADKSGNVSKYAF